MGFGIGDFGLGVECCGLVGWNWRLGLAGGIGGWDWRLGLAVGISGLD